MAMSDADKAFIQGWVEGQLESSTGMKKMELFAELLIRFPETIIDSGKPIEMMGVIDAMIAAKQIVEVQYVLPYGQGRVMSFLLPAGTTMPELVELTRVLGLIKI